MLRNVCFVLLLMASLLLSGCRKEVTPELIVDTKNYEYQWGDFDGYKYADTTGSATLVLDRKGNLYYFGAESAAPVVIMKDVRAFSLDDDSDTLGYTAPVALILTKDGDLYACGDTSYGTIRDVAVLGSIPEEGISFLEPVLINRNVKDCCVRCREINYITNDDRLYRSENYYLFETETDRVVMDDEKDEIAEYFRTYQNTDYVLSHTVQMGCGRDFFVSVLEDGSVWTCFLPEDEDDIRYAEGYGEVPGDGSTVLAVEQPLRIFPAGTCF